MSISDLSAEAVISDAFFKAIEVVFVVLCYVIGRNQSKEVREIRVGHIIRTIFLAVIIAVILPFGLFYISESIFTKSISGLSVVGFLAIVFGFFNNRQVAK